MLLIVDENKATDILEKKNVTFSHKLNSKLVIKYNGNMVGLENY